MILYATVSLWQPLPSVTLIVFLKHLIRLKSLCFSLFEEIREPSSTRVETSDYENPR